MFGGYIYHYSQRKTGSIRHYHEWVLSRGSEVGVVVALLKPYVTRIQAAVWEASIGEA